jgi:nucleoside-diphosphate-sugar epimerase
MRILVIGGNGFIGSPLVKELLGSGHEVALFHRRSNAGLADSGLYKSKETGIGFPITKVSCADFLLTSSSI